MAQHRRPAKPREEKSQSDAGRDSELRIIGGHFRGRKLRYHGDPVVRPMKHRVREAIFNLISTESAGHHAIDLFAGTGALGLEALSRGATSATFIERHVPSARVVEENFAELGVTDRVTLRVTSAFLWSKRDLPSESDSPPRNLPWLVFCSPPFSFFVEREEEMLDLIARIAERAPLASTLVIESDQRFDFARLIGENNAAWDIRDYPPARVGIWRMTSG
ncbi:MAG: RsmD family RNA methyltransferase [Pirellulales bacterium]